MPIDRLLQPLPMLAAALLLLGSPVVLAQSAPSPAPVKPPLARPEPGTPPRSEDPAARQPAPEGDMQPPGMPAEEEEEEEEQATPGEGCPYLGNKLELLV